MGRGWKRRRRWSCTSFTTAAADQISQPLLQCTYLGHVHESAGHCYFLLTFIDMLIISLYSCLLLLH